MAIDRGFHENWRFYCFLGIVTCSTLYDYERRTVVSKGFYKGENVHKRPMLKEFYPSVFPSLCTCPIHKSNHLRNPMCSEYTYTRIPSLTVFKN
jgi:hypothetical protein